MAHACPYLLYYEPDDDTKAHGVINSELRHPRNDRWRALTSDPYLLQTYRVLRAILDTINTDIARRNAELTDIRAAYVAREITEQRRRQAVTDHNTWKAATQARRDKVNARLREILPRVRTICGDAAYDHLHATLLTLAAAVAAHQNARQGDTSTADRLLYARLDALTVPTARTFPGATVGVTPLRDALRTATRTARPNEHDNGHSEPPHEGLHTP